MTYLRTSLIHVPDGHVCGGIVKNQAEVLTKKRCIDTAQKIWGWENLPRQRFSSTDISLNREYPILLIQ